VRVATAVLRLAQGNPGGAIAATGPVVDDSVPFAGLLEGKSWRTQALLIEAIARDALGDSPAAGRALELALDRAEPSSALTVFLLHPASGLLERHSRQTAHAALIADVLNLLAGSSRAAPPAQPRPAAEPLSDTELRVLRYLPNLTAPEIAGELYVSPNTIKTHMRNLYAKLGTHRRAETVARARDLGLLAPRAARTLR